MKVTYKKYGFQAYLSPEFPSQIVVDVTEFCNLACIHCPQKDFSKSKSIKRRHLEPELHEKLIDEIVKESKGNCKYIRYTAQGETLLHPNIAEMVRYAKKNSGVPVNLTTNGVFLTEKNAKSLLEAGVSVVDISIDANTPETYSKVRRKGKLHVTKQNVLQLIEIIRKGRHNTKVVVSFVEQRLNRHEAKDFKKFWEKAGVDYVVIRRLHSAAGAKKELVMVDKERYPCLYPWERLMLAPDGYIHFCPQDWVHGSTIGKFKNTTIKEIWKGSFMKKLREAHLKNDFTDQVFCGQCPDWSTTRWPDENRSYYNMMREFTSVDSNNKKGGNL